MSVVDHSLAHPIRPAFSVPGDTSNSTLGATVDQEPAGSLALVAALKMIKHPEGGYFVETDREARRVANPFHPSYESGITTVTTDQRFTETTASAAPNPTANGDGASAVLADLTRCASTSIYYLLTQARSFGRFHRNKGRTVHTLHKGRARYVIIHADEVVSGVRRMGEARIETYVVGHDVAEGERLQWIVEGGKYKASFLLPDSEGGEKSRDGCLISETVIPGFEYADHDFLKPERLVELVGHERAAELTWLLSKSAY
ncbi:hypothetical protein AURDEDRAFT_160515 [Auricularia subglabra TFB-10046 SS5]|nr:hypothetical protein AURDEDRAFT_160515 [Auricularia subglabra TFB-10046 SS5]